MSKEPNFDVMSPKERRQWEAENGKKIILDAGTTREQKPRNVNTSKGNVLMKGDQPVDVAPKKAAPKKRGRPKGAKTKAK